jgi:hypothetical protein
MNERVSAAVRVNPLAALPLRKVAENGSLVRAVLIPRGLLAALALLAAIPRGLREFIIEATQDVFALIGPRVIRDPSALGEFTH